MANIYLTIKQSSREVSIGRSFAGVQMENLQDSFIAKFSDNFVDGTAYMEYQVNGEAYYVEMTKNNETYTLSIEQILISEEGIYPFQIRIQNGDVIFKTKIFYLKIYPSINAQDFPPSYTGWKDWVIEYVDENGGKINTITQNGVELPIEDKTVNITTPTKTSDLDNDSGYITENDLPPVDQTYDANSENAQSGKAVAEALGTVTGVDDYNDLHNIPIENIQDDTTYSNGGYYKKQEGFELLKYVENQVITLPQDKIYVDVSKTDEFLDFLKYKVPYEMYEMSEGTSACPLMQIGGDAYLWAVKTTEWLPGKTLYLLTRLESDLKFYFASEAGSMQSPIDPNETISWTAGWNLDDEENQSINWIDSSMQGSFTVRFLYVDPLGWNGIYLGSGRIAKEGPICIYKDSELNEKLFNSDVIVDIGMPVLTNENPSTTITLSDDDFAKIRDNEIVYLRMNSISPDNNLFIDYYFYFRKQFTMKMYARDTQQYTYIYYFGKCKMPMADNLEIEIMMQSKEVSIEMKSTAISVGTDNINSGTAPSGRVIAADGSGGASWVAQTVEGTNIKSTEQSANNVPISDGSGGASWGKITTSQMSSGNATAGTVATADGSGGVSYQAVSGGTSLNLYDNLTLLLTNSTQAKRLFNIVKNAKGNVQGYNTTTGMVYNFAYYSSYNTVYIVGMSCEYGQMRFYSASVSSNGTLTNNTNFKISGTTISSGDNATSISIRYYNDTEITQ